MSRAKVLALASLKPAEMNDRLQADYDVLEDIAQAAGARIVLTSGRRDCPPRRWQAFLRWS